MIHSICCFLYLIVIIIADQDLYHNHLVQREIEGEERSQNETKDDTSVPFLVDDDYCDEDDKGSAYVCAKKRGRPVEWLHTSPSQRGTIGKLYKRQVCYIGTEALLAFQKSKLDSIDVNVLKKLANGDFDKKVNEIDFSKADWESFEQLQQVFAEWGDEPISIEKKREVNMEQSLFKDLVVASSRDKEETIKNIDSEKFQGFIKSYLDNGGKLPKKPRLSTNDHDETKKKNNEKKRRLKKIINEEERKKQQHTIETQEDAEFDAELLSNRPINNPPPPPAPAPPNQVNLSSAFMRNIDDDYSTQPVAKFPLEVFLEELKIRSSVTYNDTVLSAELKNDFLLPLRLLKESVNLKQDLASPDRYKKRLYSLVQRMFKFKVVFNNRKLQLDNVQEQLTFFSSLCKIIQRMNLFDEEKVLQPLSHFKPLNCEADTADSDYNILLKSVEQVFFHFKGIIDGHEFRLRSSAEDIGRLESFVQLLESVQRQVLNKETEFSFKGYEDFFLMFAQSVGLPIILFSQNGVVDDGNGNISSSWGLISFSETHIPIQNSLFYWDTLFDAFSTESNVALCFDGNKFSCADLPDDARKNLGVAFIRFCKTVEKLVENLEELNENPPVPQQQENPAEQQEQGRETKESKRKRRREENVQMLQALKIHLTNISSAANSQQQQSQTQTQTSEAMGIIDHLIKMNNNDNNDEPPPPPMMEEENE